MKLVAILPSVYTLNFVHAFPQNLVNSPSQNKTAIIESSTETNNGTIPVNLDEFNMERARSSGVEIPANSNLDVSNVKCQIKKIAPKANGSLVCPSGPKLAGPREECVVRCDRGFKPQEYSKLSCVPLQDPNTGAIYGGWSEKQTAVCSDKTSDIGVSTVECTPSDIAPIDGYLDCETTPKEYNLAGSNEVCQVACNSGFEPDPSNTYSQITCVEKSGKKGRLFGEWSETNKALCRAKQEEEENKACILALVTPDNGKIACSGNSNRSGEAFLGETCTVACHNGYRIPADLEQHRQITCKEIGNKNGNPYRFEGVWQEFNQEICQPVPTANPNEIASVTHTPYIGDPDTAGYFPDSVQVPDGMVNINLGDYFEANVNNLSKPNHWTNHWQTLPAGKCTVCNGAKSMKECYEQNKTCTLRKTQVCMSEVRKDGKGFIINRGCEARRTCLNNYHANIAFDVNRNNELLSQSKKRPMQQCRYVSMQMRQGRSQVSTLEVNSNKVCYSCHNLNLAVPYL